MLAATAIFTAISAAALIAAMTIGGSIWLWICACMYVIALVVRILDVRRQRREMLAQQWPDQHMKRTGGDA